MYEMAGFEKVLMRKAVDTGRSFQDAESGCKRFEVTRLLTFRVDEQSCRRATSAWTSCVSRTWAAPLFLSVDPHTTCRPKLLRARRPRPFYCPLHPLVLLGLHIRRSSMMPTLVAGAWQTRETLWSCTSYLHWGVAED